MWLNRQVTRAAEECASTLASSIVPEQCVRVLIPIVQTAEFPISLAAIKMQTKVMEIMPKEVLEKMVGDIIPGLLMVTCSYLASTYSSTYTTPHEFL